MAHPWPYKTWAYSSANIYVYICYIIYIHTCMGDMLWQYCRLRCVCVLRLCGCVCVCVCLCVLKYTYIYTHTCMGDLLWQYGRIRCGRTVVAGTVTHTPVAHALCPSFYTLEVNTQISLILYQVYSFFLFYPYLCLLHHPFWSPNSFSFQFLFLISLFSSLGTTLSENNLSSVSVTSESLSLISNFYSSGKHTDLPHSLPSP